MGIAFRAVLGPKYKYYMTFKENACTMSQADINSYYELLADTFIKRKTDLNDGCIQFIFDHITGTSVLDAGAGKGYLAHLLYQNRKMLSCTEKPGRSEKADMRGGGYLKVSACDIVLPEKRDNRIQWKQATLTELPYSDHAFDTVICAHTLEHIKDYKRALAELRRICSRRLIMIVPKQREYQYTFDLHLHFFPYKYMLLDFLDTKDVQIFEVEHDWVCVEDFI